MLLAASAVQPAFVSVSLAPSSFFGTVLVSVNLLLQVFASFVSLPLLVCFSQSCLARSLPKYLLKRLQELIFSLLSQVGPKQYLHHLNHLLFCVKAA